LAGNKEIVDTFGNSIVNQGTLGGIFSGLYLPFIAGVEFGSDFLLF